MFGSAPLQEAEKATVSKRHTDETLNDSIDLERGIGGGFGSFESVASANLPTMFGGFEIQVFKAFDGREHVAMQLGKRLDVMGPVLIRIHSECLTSEVFGSLLCDCREQLHFALKKITDAGAGILIYLRQEGRDIGLTNKIRAYSLQQQGLDTIDANLRLGLPIDNRSFDIAAEILSQHGVSSARLMTNNPDKVADLEAAGIEVVERVPLDVPMRRENERYLRTKADRLGHLLEHARG